MLLRFPPRPTDLLQGGPDVDQVDDRGDRAGEVGQVSTSLIRWKASDSPVSTSHSVRLRLPALTYWSFE